MGGGGKWMKGIKGKKKKKVEIKKKAGRKHNGKCTILKMEWFLKVIRRIKVI